MSAAELELIVNSTPGQSEHLDNLRRIVEEKRRIEQRWRESLAFYTRSFHWEDSDE